MTEEKQIEEMAKVIFESSPIPSVWRSDATKFAEALYNAGYRKASEVAREIFDEIESCVWSETQYGDSKLCFEINSAKYAELKKKYTEEDEGK